MVDNSNKQLKDLSPYLKFFDFSKLTFKDPILLENATVFDSLRHIEKVVKSTLSDTKQIAKHLKASDLETTLRNNWHFVHDHIAYELDKTGVEQIRRPLRLIKDKKGDCDCFSTFFSSLLTNQGIKHSLRMTKYGRDWQHVYVIVPLQNGNYYTLDAVLHRFNQEEPYTQKYDKKMQMQVLNGLGNTSNLGVISGLNFGSEFDDLQGLGYLEPSTAHGVLDEFFARLKQSLINTRNILSGSNLDNDFFQEINYLLEHFDNNIEYALDHLTIEPTQMGSLGDLGRRRRRRRWGFFRKIKSGIKKVHAGVKKVANRVGKTKFGKFVKKVGKAIVRFNPATILIRNGFYLAMRLNAFNLVGKLYYGSISEQEAMSKGIDMSEYKKLKKIFQTVKKIVVKIGGKESVFMKWFNKGVEKARKKGKIGNEDNGTNGVEGLGVVATTGVAAASGVIGTITAFLKKINFKKLIGGAKALLQKRREMKQQKADANVSTQTQNVDFSSFDDPNMNVAPTQRVAFPSNTNVQTTATDDTKKSNKGLMIAGGIAVAGAVALFMMNKKSSPAKKPLNGVRRATKKRPSTRRRTSTRRKVSVKI